MRVSPIPNSTWNIVQLIGNSFQGTSNSQYLNQPSCLPPATPFAVPCFKPQVSCKCQQVAQTILISYPPRPSSTPAAVPLSIPLRISSLALINLPLAASSNRIRSSTVIPAYFSRDCGTHQPHLHPPPAHPPTLSQNPNQPVPYPTRDEGQGVTSR